MQTIIKNEPASLEHRSSISHLPIEGLSLRDMPSPLLQVVPNPNLLEGPLIPRNKARKINPFATAKRGPGRNGEVRGLPTSSLPFEPAAQKPETLPQAISWQDSEYCSQEENDFDRLIALLEHHYTIVFDLWHTASLRQRKIFSAYNALPNELKNQMGETVMSGLDMIETHAVSLQSLKHQLNALELTGVGEALEESYQQLNGTVVIYERQELALTHIKQEVESDLDAALSKYRVDRYSGINMSIA